MFVLSFSLSSVWAQEKDFCNKINSLIDFSVDTISVSSMRNLDLNKFTILDARSKKEFKTSHIPNAHFVSYMSFNGKKFKKNFQDKDQPIIIYCSIGYRSEKIGEKLKKYGYTNVKNLYGGIFEWKNQKLPTVEKGNIKTPNVHTYSKEWSIWLKEGNKIYEE